jgi:hypothetical protein
MAHPQGRAATNERVRRASSKGSSGGTSIADDPDYFGAAL